MKILIVDDQKTCLRLLATYLTKWGYEFISANDGLEAWKLLLVNYESISLVLSDNEMPNVSGLKLLKKIKSTPRMKHIPFIMQTGLSSSEDTIKGLEAGVVNYLTKPFDGKILKALLVSALRNYNAQKALRNELLLLRKHTENLILCRYRFQRLEDLHHMIPMLASCSPEPEKASWGLHELLLNSIEHGNLGITYEEKTELNLSGEWNNEVKRRLGLPKYKDKFSEVYCDVNADRVLYRIKDEGKGFNWEPFLTFSENRAFDNHGRGIAVSKIGSFDKIRYLGCGNEVQCVININ